MWASWAPVGCRAPALCAVVTHCAVSMWLRFGAPSLGCPRTPRFISLPTWGLLYLVGPSQPHPPQQHGHGPCVSMAAGAEVRDAGGRPGEETDRVPSIEAQDVTKPLHPVGIGPISRLRDPCCSLTSVCMVHPYSPEEHSAAPEVASQETNSALGQYYQTWHLRVAAPHSGEMALRHECGAGPVKRHAQTLECGLTTVQAQDVTLFFFLTT